MKAIYFLMIISSSFALSKDWKDIKLKGFEIKGGTLSEWVQHWHNLVRDSGAYEMGFDGFEYLYPPRVQLREEVKIKVHDVPSIKALDYIAELWNCEYRVIGDRVIIQPDRKHQLCMVKVTDNLMAGIGLDNKNKPFSTQIAQKFESFGVELDSSPDSLILIENKLWIDVLVIDKDLFLAIVKVAESGLLLKMP